jgi:hypothetical protein
MKVNLEIQITGRVKACVLSANLVTSPLPSWQNTYFANFTDSSNYAKLQLPASVYLHSARC